MKNYRNKAQFYDSNKNTQFGSQTNALHNEIAAVIHTHINTARRYFPAIPFNANDTLLAGNLGFIEALSAAQGDAPAYYAGRVVLQIMGPAPRRDFAYTTTLADYDVRVFAAPNPQGAAPQTVFDQQLAAGYLDLTKAASLLLADMLPGSASISVDYRLATGQTKYWSVVHPTVSRIEAFQQQPALVNMPRLHDDLAFLRKLTGMDRVQIMAFNNNRFSFYMIGAGAQDAEILCTICEYFGVRADTAMLELAANNMGIYVKYEVTENMGHYQPVPVALQWGKPGTIRELIPLIGERRAKEVAGSLSVTIDDMTVYGGSFVREGAVAELKIEASVIPAIGVNAAAVQMFF